MKNPLPFLWAKMAAENQRCWKLLRYPMDLIRKAARKIILFQPMILILRCIMRFVFQKDSVRQNGGIFSEQKAFIMLQPTQEEAYADFEHPSEKYHEKSHGESFLAITQNYLRPNGLYLFDEPEAALSPQRQLTLLMEIDSCAKAGSQFIIVTHSPILLGIPDAQILSFDGGAVHECAYEDTESYKVTEMFINNRHILLNKLLSE